MTAAELIDDLSSAFRAGRFADALATYTHPAVLVVDEVGYLTYGTDAANMLFHVVNDRHRHRRSMIFTTNKALTAWGRILHDDDLAHAIIDRVLERGRLLPLDGPSMRTKHLGLDDPTSPEASHQLAGPAEAEVIRISGTEAPEFPEPTAAMSLRRFLGSAVHRVLRNQLLSTIDAIRKLRRSSGCRDRYQKHADTAAANTAKRRYSHCSLDIALLLATVLGSRPHQRGEPHMAARTEVDAALC